MEDNGFATGYAVGRDTNGNGGYGNGMWGNDAWWIIVLLLFGWGRNGFGGYGGGYGTGGVGENYVLATDFANIERKIDGVNNGLCDSTFALNNNINANFRNVDNARGTKFKKHIQRKPTRRGAKASKFGGTITGRF